MLAKAAAERGDAVGVGLCVGASLEFLVGRIRRAPSWMQAARLEWLHRLLSEPRRLARRYLIEGPKILAIWGRWRQEAA
jgi:exopolysaccharide biosynthesis WecB/TagA/CpsF family protein